MGAARPATLRAVLPDPATCYEALASRDRRFEGRFVVGVTTTGIYCRPGCPARLPKREHTRFFAGPVVAEAAGFRACRRCRPDRGVEASLWGRKSATVAHALRLLEEDEFRGDELALRAGVSARQLRRLFRDELGTSPHALVAARRLRLARELIEAGELTLTAVAFASGFGSLRRFQAAWRAAHGSAPGRGGKTRLLADTELCLRLPFRPPLAFAPLLEFLAARAIPGLESVDGQVYRRRVGSAEITVTPADANSLALRVRGARGVALLPLVTAVRRLFDLDADPVLVDAHLRRDPLLRAHVAAWPGMRIPGAFDRFELLVRAVLGQQIRVAAARTLAGRLAADGFPTPQELAAQDLRPLGLPRARAGALTDLARRVAAGTLDLTRGIAGPAGVGPWTAQYYALRGLGDCDAFPAGDHILAPFAARAERWRPWRGYAAIRLWHEATNPCNTDSARRSARSP